MTKIRTRFFKSTILLSLSLLVTACSNTPTPKAPTPITKASLSSAEIISELKLTLAKEFTENSGAIEGGLQRARNKVMAEMRREGWSEKKMQAFDKVINSNVRERFVDAMSQAYAENLSLEDLRELTVASRKPAIKAYLQALARKDSKAERRALLKSFTPEQIKALIELKDSKGFQNKAAKKREITESFERKLQGFEQEMAILVVLELLRQSK